MAVTQIEVFADIVCPFTHVGLRRLIDERLARGRDDLAIVVRAWPLELVNKVPLDPAFVDEEVAALQSAVAPHLFKEWDPSTFPSTSIPALGLEAAAYDLGPAVGEAMSLRLRAELFEHGRDISDPELLRTVALDLGVPLPDPLAAEARARDAWAEGRERGVIGSPHFFVDSVGHFCPTLKISHESGHFDIRFDEVGYASFMAEVFG